MLRVLSALMLSVILGGCGCEGIDLPENQADQVIISQGVWGHTWFWEGFRMPGDGCSSYPTVAPVSAEVIIYREVPVARFLELAQDYPGRGFVPRAVLEADLEIEPVGSQMSTPSGFFEIPLDPGRYSLLVSFDGHLYAPEGWPVRVFVNEGEVTFSDFEIRERPEQW